MFEVWLKSLQPFLLTLASLPPAKTSFFALCKFASCAPVPSALLVAFLQGADVLLHPSGLSSIGSTSKGHRFSSQHLKTKNNGDLYKFFLCRMKYLLNFPYNLYPIIDVINYMKTSSSQSTSNKFVIPCMLNCFRLPCFHSIHGT